MYFHKNSKMKKQIKTQPAEYVSNTLSVFLNFKVKNEKIS